MVSGNDAAQSRKPAEVQPPVYGNGNGDDPRFPEGLYVLMNKMTRTVLNLNDPSPGRRCVGYQRTYGQFIGNQLWLIKQDDVNSNYTLKNFRHNSFLDLSDGNPRDGAYVTGRPRVLEEESRFNQEWRIEEPVPNRFTIQCARTDTFLELANERNETPATCSAESEQKDHQFWRLEKVSRSTREIKALIEQWRPYLLSRLFQPYDDRAEYFVLPDDVRKSIWESTQLRTRSVHEHMFDYDDFVVKAKDAVKTWAADHYPTVNRGYSVLFGIIYGKESTEPRAYNWYLTPDMTALTFFDAQTGMEYTTAAVDLFGFEPSFATF